MILEGRGDWEAAAKSFEAILEKDPENVQAIVTLLEGYPIHRARGAARRAHFYQNFTGLQFRHRDLGLLESSRCHFSTLFVPQGRLDHLPCP